MSSRTTTTGLAVCGLGRTYHPKYNSYSGVTGRVRVVKDNSYHYDYANWDDSGRAINHEYGDLMPPTARQSMIVDGFNLMDGLRARE